MGGGVNVVEQFAGKGSQGVEVELNSWSSLLITPSNNAETHMGCPAPNNYYSL